MKNKIIFFLMALIPNIVFASNYEITDDNINIKVNDEEIEIKEIIESNFNNENTDVIFKINEKELIKESISISSDYIIKDNNIIINNKDSINHKYSINYKLKNNNKNNYSIELSNKYDANINKINFKIEFEDNISDYEVKIYLNEKEIKSSSISYEINKYTISGQYNKTINENDKLVIKLTKKKNNITILMNISYIVPLIFVSISYLIWLMFGKDRKIKIEKTSKPIKKLNPAEISLIYNEEANKKDIIYMILDLANKGYINIIEKDNDFILRKNKDYDGKSLKEAHLFKSLFKKMECITLSDYIEVLASKKMSSKKITYNKEISVKEISKRMEGIIRSTLALINSDEDKKLYYEEKSESKKSYLLIMITIILLLITTTPVIMLNMTYLIPLSVIISIMSLNIINSFINKIDLTKIKFKNIAISLIIITLITLLVLIPLLNNNLIYLIIFINGIICSILILILYKYMPKRTIYATNLMGSIEGLKEFIKTCKENELNRVLELNPNYLYEILPYSYVIGIEQEVFNKIKEKNQEIPSWFKIEGKKDIDNLKNKINKLSLMLLKYYKDEK